MSSPSFDFSRVIDRRSTRSIKWNLADQKTLPMWVADMDFAVPPAVVEAISRRLEHPILGYTAPDAEFTGAFCAWQRERNGWEVDPEWVQFSPGVMPLVSLAVETETSPGAGVIVPTPVYYPFYRAIEGHRRRVLRAPLVNTGNRYELDLDRIASLAPQAEMILLCSPHNPGGRVWERSELEALAAVAARYDLLVVSDEIHGDLVYPGQRFVPFCGVDPPVRSIAIHAPNKTFNIAGIASATAVVPDAAVRRSVDAALETHMMRLPNTLALEAAIAAYRHGAPWLDELRAYLADNAELIHDRCASDLDGVVPMVQEGTFIQWIDFRDRWSGDRGAPLAGDESDAFDAHCRNHGLWLSSGSAFGPEGNGFMRLNFGCPRATLDEGLARLVRATGSFQPARP